MTSAAPSAPTTIRLFIEGRVQGVGYRAWAVQAARRLGLYGWVRNLSDGSVEALVHGPFEQVEQFVAGCQAGPFMAKVSAVIRESASGDVPEGPFQQLPTAERKG